MAVKVIIPTPLRAYAGKQESVEVQAGTVGEALAALTGIRAERRRYDDLDCHSHSSCCARYSMPAVVALI